MPNVRQRIASLEQTASAGFAGFVVICSWEYYGATIADGITAYIAANGPIPDDKQVVVMGWSD